jgi:hypothetical protein
VPFTPYEAGIDAIGRARALLTSTTAPHGQQPSVPVGIRTDLRRMSIVMAIAALDTYMHRLVIERAYTHDELPGALARLDVPFEALLAQADETAAAARQPPTNSRPRVAVKRQLRDRLLRETFQAYDDVSRALAMAGKSGLWDHIGAKCTPAVTPKQIKERLRAIVMRRNQIVHEGDYERLERPQNARRNTVTYADALSSIDFIEQLIKAIHAV